MTTDQDLPAREQASGGDTSTRRSPATPGREIVRVDDEANARLIAAAPEMKNALRLALDLLLNEVGADCPYCNGEGTWTDSFDPTATPRMVGVVHKSDCAITTINAVLAKAEGRS